MGPRAGLDLAVKRKTPIIASAGSRIPVVKARSPVTVLTEIPRLLIYTLQ